MSELCGSWGRMGPKHGEEWDQNYSMGDMGQYLFRYIYILPRYFQGRDFKNQRKHHIGEEY